MRSAYETDVRFWEDSDQTVRIRWYRVAPSNPILPFPTIFSSWNWDNEDSGGKGMHGRLGTPLQGEQIDAKRPWSNGSPLVSPPTPGPHVCGTAEQWAGGLRIGRDLPLPTNSYGQPLCCGWNPEDVVPAVLKLGIRLRSGFQVSDAILTDEGQVEAVREHVFGLQRGRFALFTDAISPLHNVTLASLHECSFPGYSRQSTRWTAPFLNGDGEGQTNGQAVYFTRGVGAGTQTARLWGFVNNNRLVWVKPLPVPVVFAAPGDQAVLVPVSYFLCHCTGSPVFGTVPVRGGFGLGGNVMLLPAGALPVRGGFGLGGSVGLVGHGLLPALGGFGLGGSANLRGGGLVPALGGFGLGGSAGLPGHGPLPALGGFGLGGSVDLTGGNIYRLVNLFTAANGTLLSAYTPNVGPAWTQVLGTSTIQSNQLSVSAGSFQTQDAGVASYTMRVDQKSITGVTSLTFFRYTNTLNYWFVQQTPSGFSVSKVVAGAQTVVGSNMSALAAGTIFTQTVVTAGNSISVTINGHTVSTTDSFNNTATKVGVGASGSAGVADNLFLL